MAHVPTKFHWDNLQNERDITNYTYNNNNN